MQKPEFKNLRIISLVAENMKRLVAVHIRPGGRVVQITGRNGQGKTSVLDCLWWALAGGRNIQTQPIRKGQQRGFITLELGSGSQIELIVTRSFKRKGDVDYTSEITVESPQGGLFRSPQELINGLWGSLSFDPLQFARMDEKEQFQALQRFVPEIDFETLDAQNAGDRKRRTTAGQVRDEAAAAASLIVVPDDTPDEEVPKDELLVLLNDAYEHNAKFNDAVNVRKQAEDWCTNARATVGNVEQQIAAAIKQNEEIRDAAIAEKQAQILGLQTQIGMIERSIERSRTMAEETNARESQRLRDKAAEVMHQIQETEAKLASMPVLKTIDIDAINAQIRQADEVNKQVARKAERARHLATAARYKAEWDDLTNVMKARVSAKQKAIAAADLPVKELGFGDGIVLLNGVPFKQASDAEQLTTSVAIAMKANPKLRVIRIRDGSLLDDQAMELLDKMAEEHDFQVWVERVDGSGTVGFVLEDGHVRNADSAEGAAS